jgi:hypothetical protein
MYRPDNQKFLRSQSSMTFQAPSTGNQFPIWVRFVAQTRDGVAQKGR